MSEHLDPLPPDVQALLEAERRRPDLPREIQTRTLSRLAVTLGIGGGGGGAGGSGQPAGLTSASSLTKTLLTFVLGTAVGASGYALLRRTREAPPQVAPVTAPAPTPVTVEPAPPAGNEVKAPAPRPAPTRAVDDRAAGGRDTDLARERALLEVARTALSRGQNAAARSALERHAQSFPKGQMLEERESLWVQALVAAGEYPAARARGERFRKRFPRSIFLPVVDGALRSIP